MHGRAARPLGPGARRLGGLLRHLALRGGGGAGDASRGHQGADHEAGGRRRPLHLAGRRWCGRCGRACSTSSARPAVDRRPVPAEEDRGGAGRGHPRMHRLQHLHHRRHDHVDQPLHPEPDLHGGMAQGLAPGADAARRERRANVLVVGAGPAGLEAARGARPARLRGGAGRGRDASSAGGWRASGCCRGCPPGGGSPTTASTSSRSGRTSRPISTAGSAPTRSWSSASSTSRSPPARAGGRDGVARMHVVPMPIDPALPVFTPDDLMDGRLPSGEVVVFDDDHYYMGGVLAELLAQGRLHGDAGHAVGLRLGLDAQHAGTGGDPAPAGRGRRADRAQHRGGGGAGGRRRDRVQLHRRRRPDRLRRRGPRRVAAVGGRALSRR